MVIEVASRQTSFLGWFIFSSECSTQHCCLSETELYCISHLTEIRVPNTVYTGTYALSFRTHAQVHAWHAVPMMVGRLTDVQAEPNLQSKCQGGRMIGKVRPVHQGIFKHERLARLQICNSITEHTCCYSAPFRSLRTQTVLPAGTDMRLPSWSHWVSMCRDLILLRTILHNTLKNVKAAQRRMQSVFVWCVKERVRLPDA